MTMTTGPIDGKSGMSRRKRQVAVTSLSPPAAKTGPRLKEADSVKVPRLPEPQQFCSWRLVVRQEVAGASDRPYGRPDAA